ncbi:MAG: outer membrane beta-barrel protein [Deltaproteobacteria bacterium]|nr:outer membrane beta-barrel protein [Deltaproteobacteria bacterium]
MKRYVFTTAMAVAVGVSLANLKAAEGKLVFEDELKAPARNTQAQEGVVVRYRDPVADLNEPVTASPRAIETAPQVPVAQALPVVQASPAAQQPEARETVTRSEQMRRQRMREELKNEDLLTQKLEELRLKDEMQRTDQILGSGVQKAPAELQEQRVGTAATEAPAVLVAQASTTGANTALANTSPQTTAVAARGDSIGQSTATASVASMDFDEDKTRVTVSPRGGMSGITNSMYDVQSLYSMGLGVGVDLSDFISFQGGYTFSKYNLAAGNTIYNPGVTLQQLEMNDNVFDMGVRANFLGPKARMRPFIGAGVGYRRGYVNYDSQTLNMLRAYNPYGASQQLDVELSAFMGYIETGLELRITKSVSLSGMVRYFNILSSRQTNPVSPYAFVNPNGLAGGYGSYGGYGLAGGYGGFGYTGDARTQASRALADNNFYQLMAGLSIAF